MSRLVALLKFVKCYHKLKLMVTFNEFVLKYLLNLKGILNRDKIIKVELLLECHQTSNKRQAPFKHLHPIKAKEKFQKLNKYPLF